MATFGELTNMIAAELVRDDLGLGEENVALTQSAIRDAIREYTARNWWFLTVTTTVPTVASQNYITRPAAIDQISRVSIPALGMDLCLSDLTEIEQLDEPATQTGQPQSYAEGQGGAQLRLWPTPSAVYSVKITGTARLAALAADGDTNVWTDENVGYPLIKASAKKRLFRFPLRDEGGFMLASSEEREALAALNLTNVNRLRGPVRAGW